MPHPAVVNKTGYVLETLLLADEEGVPLYVPCVQAVFAIPTDGALSLLEVQPPIDVGGRWRGDPASTSMAIEPQSAFTKPGTDVVLLGHAHAQSRGSTEGAVGIRVGPVQKAARVFGNRWIVSRLGGTGITRPEPFDRIPIEYERSFGGWDRFDPDPARHRCEARNPVGVGFRVTPQGSEEQPLPNFEDPQRPFRGWGDTPRPAGFGFIAPDWEPRASLAGTYDATWDRTRKPLLPADFDRRFFNAASPGLVVPSRLRGDESVVVVGAAPEGRVDFSLPGLPPPVCLVALRGRRRIALQVALDTVIVDMDSRTVTLVWRGHIAVRNGPHDVLAVELHPDLDSAAVMTVATA